MNQFIIENPVLCIVIAFIIGAIVITITSALTVRMMMEKEVARALGEEEEERKLWNEEPKFSDRTERLTVIVGADGDGCRCLYLDTPLLYSEGEGPLSEMGHDYYYHSKLQFLAEDFDLDKLAEIGIDIRPEVKFNPMELKWFRLENDKVAKFLEEAFDACGKTW